MHASVVAPSCVSLRQLLELITMTSSSKVAVGLAVLLLVITAAYHGSGVTGIGEILRSPDHSPEIVRLFSGLWLFVSWHWLAVSVAAISCVFIRSLPSRVILGFCSFIVFTDFAWVFVLAGFFEGTALLLVSGILLLAGGLMQKKTNPF